MKKIFLGLLIFSVNAITLSAQLNLDKEISKISRDTKNYISAEVRGSSEEDAYQEALKQLSDQVTEYYKSLDNNTMPTTVYLSNVSRRYERLVTHSSDNRYRVLVYVKKTDLLPMGSNSSSLILSKNENDSYSVVTTDLPKPVVVTKTDTIIEIVEKEVPFKRAVPKQVSKISGASSEKEVNDILVIMRKANEITGAATFPIANYGNFYVVVLNSSNSLETILYFDGSSWTEALSGTIANPYKYKDCKAFWFILPN